MVGVPGVGLAVTPPAELIETPVGPGKVVLLLVVGVVVAGVVGVVPPTVVGFAGMAATPSAATVCASSRPVVGSRIAAWNERTAARVGAASVPSIGPL